MGPQGAHEAVADGKTPGSSNVPRSRFSLRLVLRGKYIRVLMRVRQKHHENVALRVRQARPRSRYGLSVRKESAERLGAAAVLAGLQALLSKCELR